MSLCFWSDQPLDFVTRGKKARQNSLDSLLLRTRRKLCPIEVANGKVFDSLTLSFPWFFSNSCEAFVEPLTFGGIGIVRSLSTILK